MGRFQRLGSFPNVALKYSKPVRVHNRKDDGRRRKFFALTFSIVPSWAAIKIRFCSSYLLLRRLLIKSTLYYKKYTVKCVKEQEQNFVTKTDLISTN